MKYNYTFEQFKKLYIASLLMIGALIFGQVNGPALEMTAGSGNTVANGPTTVAQTIFFQNNTDNTGAGTTFTTYAPTLSATYAISNIRSGNVINFGQTTTGAVPIFELMNAQGAPADANFTSAGAAVGTGIVGATNRAVRLYVQTLPLRTANRPTNSTTDIADLTITFNRPVNNPVIHIGGLGGTSNTTPVLGFSGVLDLTSFVGTNVSLTRLSGNGTTSFQSTSTSISNGSTTFTSTGANSGSGSVRVNGTGITSLTFKIAIKGDGANTAVTAWSPNSDAAVGEAFSVGFSTLESDIQVTKTMANTTAAVGANTTFTVTATNNGPSNNANINITDVLPTGYSLNGTATTTVGTYTSGTGVWNIPTLNVGASAILTIPVTVRATGNYVNTATITSAALADSNTGNNRATAARLPDSDGDGVFDNVDMDDDNDGIPDTLEDNCVKTSQIVNGNFSGSATSWASGYYTTPNTTGGLTFNGSTLEILADNAGSLYSGNVILANTVPVNLRAGVYYNFSSTLNIFSGTTNVNFAWVLLDSSNNIVQTIQTYKTLAGGVGDVQITNTATAYPVTFFATGTGSYRLAMTWVTNSATSGNGQDIRIDDVTLLAPCNSDADSNPNYLDLDSDNDGCFDAIEGDENVLLSQINTNGSINTTANGGVGTIVGTNNGVPNIVNSGGSADTSGDVGQGIGDSQNSANNTQCIDTDGDGVQNDFDLDKDNDGILDTDECGTVSVNPSTVNLPNGATQTLTAPAADDGYIFDVLTLDNSFNLTVNGNPLLLGTSNELQFQTGSATLPKNVRFVDGSEYGVGVGQIWTIIGTAATPILRIRINRNGTVNLFGSKVSGGPLFPLEVYNGSTLNTLSWNTSTANTLTLSQDVSGATYITGNGRGSKLGTCDADGDGIPNYLDLDSDGDGCSDAFEGGANITNAQLVIAGGSLSGGSTAVNQNLCATGACVNASGVPQFTTIPTGYNNSSGQAAGQSQDSSRNDCLDTDGDGIPDWQDLDDDNDGILDTAEKGSCGVAGSIMSMTGYKSKVYNAIAGTDAWTEMNASTSFPTVSFNQIATFDYNEFASTQNAFSINFESAGNISGTNPEISNYQGTVLGAPTHEYAILFSKLINDDEIGTYQYNLIDADNHVFIYKNGVKVASRQNVYSTPIPANNFVTISVNQGDRIDIVLVEEDLNNTYLNISAVKTVGQCMKDTDGDGIPDHLDLDSDNDGCPDAIEGGATITNAQLVNAGGTLQGGNGTSPAITPTSGSYNQSVLLNLCATGACVNANGIPQLSPLPAGYSNTTGQSIGDSQNALINLCYCYKKPVVNAGTTIPVQHGITALTRAGGGTTEWPTVRQSAWTVLEANTKGFVVNKVAFEDADNNATTPTTPVGISVGNYVEGMMVYDTVANCLKIYNGTFWNCYSTQTCPQ